MSMDLEAMVYSAILCSCLTSLTVIILNGILLCYLEHGLATSEIAACEEKFVGALRTAKFAAASFTILPIVGVVALSKVCGLTMEQVLGEYDKDSMERRSIIHTVFGQDIVTKSFIDMCPKFLRDGYKEENLLFAEE